MTPNLRDALDAGARRAVAEILTAVAEPVPGVPFAAQSRDNRIAQHAISAAGFAHIWPGAGTPAGKLAAVVASMRTVHDLDEQGWAEVAELAAAKLDAES